MLNPAYSFVAYLEMWGLFQKALKNPNYHFHQYMFKGGEAGPSCAVRSLIHVLRQPTFFFSSLLSTITVLGHIWLELGLPK